MIDGKVSKYSQSILLFGSEDCNIWFIGYIFNRDGLGYSFIGWTVSRICGWLWWGWVIGSRMNSRREDDAKSTIGYNDRIFG